MVRPGRDKWQRIETRVSPLEGGEDIVVPVILLWRPVGHHNSPADLPEWNAWQLFLNL